MIHNRVVDNRSDTAQTGAIRNATTPVKALRELRREGQELNRIR
jgi:hypothetical protein